MVFHAVQLAGVRVELNQLREELDETLQKEDYQRAAELKEKLSDLESSKATLLEETLPTSQEVRTEKVSTRWSTQTRVSS